MHQPEYRVAGRFMLPWVYLHAIGAYTDMATHLEAVDGARAVVNFSPVLLDQIQDYASRLNAPADFSAQIGDSLLDALRELPPAGPQRTQVLQRCLPVHRNRRTDRHPEFLDLVERARIDGETGLSDAHLTDLIVWFHLGWLAESLRGDARAQRLHAKREHFDARDCKDLLALIGDALAGILPRYRALLESGRVELSMTPYYHPLLPLLCDFNSAADNAPDVSLPTTQYTGGADRARWHLLEGRRRFVEIFGQAPQGCWPSEAALSEPTLALLDELGFTWTASSRSVLAGTLHHHGGGEPEPFHAFRRDDQKLLCYFRDDGLSDRIGFAYQNWSAGDAAQDLVRSLEQIAETASRDLIFIALDGENPWEYFADNGLHFVRGVYQALASHPALRLSTLAECSAALTSWARPLPSLRAGSWVHGQLLTWIGHPEKNRAWSLLMDARSRFLSARNPSSDALAALGACEGSDWFWWPGAENPPTSVSDFDHLFRAHLTHLYRSLGEAPPAVLSRPFAGGTADHVAAGGIMRPTDATWIARSAGVLLDLHALPVPGLDGDALRFAKLVADAGFRVWQLLPVGPRDEHGNPFAPASAFAGDTMLAGSAADDDTDFAAFCERESDWLDDWALFIALKQSFSGKAWVEWPQPLRDRNADALIEARKRMSAAVENERRLQYRFDRDWSAFKRAANAMGLKLFGDLPLFIAHDSADVWAHPELFELDASGHCAAVVGVPPDAFSADGQSWGSPPYDWSAMAAENFRWWQRRFEVQAQRFDIVRLDHFRGLAAWWRIPAGSATAAAGKWIPGPGAAAIEALRPVLHGAPLVAEDLGIITDDVIALRKRQNIPGMRVLQFGFDGDPENPHRPDQHAPDSVSYTGTHDNDTTLGWWNSLSTAERLTANRQLGAVHPSMPDTLLEMNWGSVAPLAIAPMQDLLALDSSARTNLPGTINGNWQWQFAWSQIPNTFAETLRNTLQRHGRIPEQMP